MEKALLSFKQLISYLDCSKGFIYDQIKRGTIKPKYLGAKPFFDIQQIKAALTESSIKSNTRNEHE